MIRLSAKNISRCYFLNKKSLKKIVSTVFKYLGINNAGLSIAFTTDREIRRLNLLYRNTARPTDVLAFSMSEGKRLKSDSLILGDIAISVDRAKRQAEIFKTTFKNEILLYIVHGILHLIGYDDETPHQKKRMRRKENEILSMLLRRKWQRAN